jgi:methylmalonyl-CoA epimerase
LRIDHVGIVVRNLEEAVKHYVDLLEVNVTFEENIGWKSAILITEAGKLELMQPTDPESAVGKFLTKRGEGLHHVALEVDNVQAYLDKAAQIGLTPIDKQPRRGSENKLIAFIHPSSLSGVLLEFNMP